MTFTLAAEDPTTDARAGVVTTDHGAIETPIFMPVGTLGTVKAVEPRQLRDDLGAQIILGNTYHLFLRPGMEVMEAAGGLHQFMRWDGPILTDSGGFQVFSLADSRKITEEGVTFQSHLDGSRHLFTPESVVDTQRSIGSDIMMVLDECPPADVDEAYARKSNALTMRWAKRCQDHFRTTEAKYGHSQTLFPIVQGVTYPAVRRESARQLVDMDFEGYAIGGLSVGEPAPVMYEVVEVVTAELPREKPRYLMGVGTPANLIENIARGVDMFDCVLPTRNGRNGTIYTTEGQLNIRNAKWKTDFSPIDPGLEHYAGHFSKSYLRHLLGVNEVLGMMLASQQNLALFLWLVREARRAITEGRYGAWMREWLPRLSRRL
ncbi:MAG: tRNA guanosine(34) transglycosylase Tgt [Bacteroidota bacterium]